MPDIVSNLAAHYTFNSDGADSSGNDRHLTSGTVSHVAGYIGNCARGGYHLYSATFLDSLATYTVACFARGHSGGAQQAMVVAMGTDDNRASLAVKCPPGYSHAAHSAGRDGVIVIRQTPNAIVNGGWKFLALVVSSGMATLYEADAGSAAEALSISTGWTLPASCSLFVGGSDVDVDQLRIYTRALAAADVAVLAAET